MAAKILVVDDEDTIRNVLADAFQDAGEKRQREQHQQGLIPPGTVRIVNFKE